MGAPKNNDYAIGNPGGGRNTSFKPEYVDRAYEFSLLGATDKEMARIFEVSETTINNWKKNHKEFSLALKKGKALADAEVAEKLYQRAVGYDYEERKEEYNPKTNELIRVTIIKKHVMPDTTAQIFWLKNRQPDKWRDTKNIDHVTDGKPIEMTKEEIKKRIVELVEKAGGTMKK